MLRPRSARGVHKLSRVPNPVDLQRDRISAPHGLYRLLIIGRRQLERVLRVYVRHYNEQRPHRALDLQAPDPRTIPPARCGPLGSPTAIRRQDLLGGLIHEYEAAAA